MSAPIGQVPRRATITNITNALPCVVTTEEAHEFSTRDFVRLTGLNMVEPTPPHNPTVKHGMDPLNNFKYRIIVTGATTFSLQHPITFAPVDSTNYTPYIKGGEANLVNPTFIFYPSADQEYPN